MNKESLGVILVIDDEDIVRSLLSDMIQSIGYKVVDFADPMEAIEFYDKNHEIVDLVFIDMTMPKLNGRETFFLLKKINRKIKSVVLSGFSMNDDVEKILKEGCMAYLKKPTKIKDLQKTISSLLNKESVDLEISAFEDIAERINIPGADLKEAIENVGSSQIFIKMMSRYLESYGNAGAKMRELIENKECEELFVFSHSIKSIAAGLGLSDLRNEAGKIETMCQRKEYDKVVENINVFDLINIEVCSRFREFLSTFGHSEEAGNSTEEETDNETLLTYLDELLKYAALSRPVPAIGIFHRKLKNINVEGFNFEIKDKIKKLLAGYDFEDLEQYLKKLINVLRSKK